MAEVGSGHFLIASSVTAGNALVEVLSFPVTIPVWSHRAVGDGRQLQAVARTSSSLGHSYWAVFLNSAVQPPNRPRVVVEEAAASLLGQFWDVLGSS